MDETEYKVKLFQQQIVKLLQTIEYKTDEYNELKQKSEALDIELANTLIRMSVLKFEIRDMREKFENTFICENGEFQ